MFLILVIIFNRKYKNKQCLQVKMDKTMYARDQDHEYANMLILKAFHGLNQMLSKMRTPTIKYFYYQSILLNLKNKNTY